MCATITCCGQNTQDARVVTVFCMPNMSNPQVCRVSSQSAAGEMIFCRIVSQQAVLGVNSVDTEHRTDSVCRC